MSMPHLMQLTMNLTNERVLASYAVVKMTGILKSAEKKCMFEKGKSKNRVQSTTACHLYNARLQKQTRSQNHVT